MSQAIPVAIKQGTLHKSHIYAKIKNGNVYKFNRRVLPSIAGEFIAIIQHSPRINLKYWTLVQKH